MKTKSVLVLTNSLQGLWNFRKEVFLGIIRKGYKVFISCPETVTDFKDKIEAMGCQVIFTNFNGRGMNPLADILLITKYVNLIKRTSPLCVLTYTIKPNIYGGMACRLCGVAHLPNITGLGDAIENGGILQKLSIMLYRMGIRKAEVSFFQNSTNRSFCMRHGILKGNSVLLPGSGVNLQHHSYQDYPDEQVSPIKILFIGRLKWSKGVDELFDAASMIKSKYGDAVEFLVLGSEVKGCQTRLKEAEEKGILKYLGYAADVRPYIGQAHCTVMPSYYEGMSNVNLESAANGRPVITTDVPGCWETVEDGRTGFIVKPHDARSLYDAIDHFISLPYETKRKMGEEARRKVEREFDRNIIVENYLNEIEKLRLRYLN